MRAVLLSLATATVAACSGPSVQTTSLSADGQTSTTTVQTANLVATTTTIIQGASGATDGQGPIPAAGTITGEVANAAVPVDYFVGETYRMSTDELRTAYLTVPHTATAPFAAGGITATIRQVQGQSGSIAFISDISRPRGEALPAQTLLEVVSRQAATDTDCFWGGTTASRLPRRGFPTDYAVYLDC